MASQLGDSEESAEDTVVGFLARSGLQLANAISAGTFFNKEKKHEPEQVYIRVCLDVIQTKEEMKDVKRWFYNEMQRAKVPAEYHDFCWAYTNARHADPKAVAKPRAAVKEFTRTQELPPFREPDPLAYFRLVRDALNEYLEKADAQ